MGESNSNKKRKLICREEEHEEEEETKMETFFALVRNFRDTRDRWMGLRSGDRKSKRGKIITAKEEGRVWKPRFHQTLVLLTAKAVIRVLTLSSHFDKWFSSCDHL